MLHDSVFVPSLYKVNTTNHSPDLKIPFSNYEITNDCIKEDKSSDHFFIKRKFKKIKDLKITNLKNTNIRISLKNIDNSKRTNNIIKKAVTPNLTIRTRY